MRFYGLSSAEPVSQVRHHGYVSQAKLFDRANTGHEFAIVMACVGALRLRFRRLRPWSLAIFLI